MNKATIFSKKNCPVSWNFEDIQTWSERYAKESRIMTFLNEYSLENEFYRVFISNETPIFLMLGSIILDEFIKHGEEDIINQIKKAFTSVYKLLPELNSLAENNFQQLVSMVREERKNFLQNAKTNSQARTLFEEIYKKIVLVGPYLSALADAARVLLLHKLLNDENSRSSADLISVIAKDNSNAHYYPSILSNFASMLSYEIKLVQIQKENELNTEFKAFGRSFGSRFRASLVVVKMEKSKWSYIGYNASDLVLGREDKKDGIARSMISRKQASLIMKKTSGISNSQINQQPEDKKFDVLKHEESKILTSLTSSGKKIEIKGLNCSKCQGVYQDNVLIKLDFCRHRFCIECLLNHSDKPSNLIQPDCNCQVSIGQVHTFLSQFWKENSASALSKRIEQKLNSTKETDQKMKSSNVRNEGKGEPLQLKCNFCNHPTDGTNILKNPTCGHVFCLECVEKFNNMSIEIDKQCIIENCGNDRKKENVVNPSTKETLVNPPTKEGTAPPKKDDVVPQKQKIKILSVGDEKLSDPTEYVLISCQSCKYQKIESKFFKFPSCPHNICKDCVQTKKFEKCPMCRSDSQALPPQKTAITKMILISCINCGSINDIPQKQGDAPCFKCSQCAAAICITHDSLLSKCICFCPSCLSPVKNNIQINSKHCTKCGSNFCLGCRKETQKNEICSCLCVVCFNNATDPGYNICVQCREDPKVCFVCFDELYEDSEVELKCRQHKICRVCLMEKLKYTDLSQISCTTCDLLAEMYLENPEFLL